MTNPSKSNSNKHHSKSDNLENAIWFNSTPTDQGKYIEVDVIIDETTRKRRAKRSALWQNHIDGDLKHEVEMHRLLVHWAQSGVSMKQIGESPVNMLYRR
ncbi:uncharacterized protein N7473_007920 [Penicillium subrubescens]|uniref:Uncharacterized protein n=1 Tax=Penicillium subrubescens TaxID=1316194 RepID=A0A1Q5TJH0_9EURO|nr:uncharacterized protein N7473_007920 [Penicillium subrubescens]KAJ5891692.1 hypothetical protein N7473_007920 [Penicillium subrubescens]OKP00367.1 hypothetical protein PENSUB_7824 [Penicillium subrubescens]